MNDNNTENFNVSIKQLNNSLFRYRLSLFYRKINLDNFYSHKKTYNDMTRIMYGLENLIKNHDSINNIVLVLNNDKYELYMIGNNSFSKMLEDKGMIILKYLISSNNIPHSRKRKINPVVESYDKEKKYKPKQNVKVNLISKKELKNKRSNPKDSVDNKLIEKFKNLSEKDKNDLLSLLNKSSNNIVEDKMIDIVIDKTGETQSSEILINNKNDNDEKSEKINKYIEKSEISTICEPSLGEIIIDNSANKSFNQECKIREKRNIKKVLTYGQEFC